MKATHSAKTSEKTAAESTTKRSTERTVYALAGAAALALLTSGASTAALAGDVYWSVGVSSPGVHLGVLSPQPVYVQPQTYYVQPQPYYVQPSPYYVQPQPVYSQPQVIYSQPRPGYVQPRPVYVQPTPIYVQPQPAVVYNRWHHPRHGGHHGPRPYPQQVVQTYPLHYQMPVDGDGFTRR